MMVARILNIEMMHEMKAAVKMEVETMSGKAPKYSTNPGMDMFEEEMLLLLLLLRTKAD